MGRVQPPALGRKHDHYAYDQASNVAAVTYPNGVQTPQPQADPCRLTALNMRPSVTFAASIRCSRPITRSISDSSRLPTTTTQFSRTPALLSGTLRTS